MSTVDIEIKLTGADKAVDGLHSIEQVSEQVAKSFGDGKTAAASLSSGLEDLLNKYDPLGVKLRALQADFQALNRAASSGQIGPQHDAAVDTAYQALNAQIAQTKIQMGLAGAAGVKGFTETAVAAEKSMLATAGAKRELMVLGHEAMSGNFSRMPGSFMVLAERMDLTAALMSPVTLGLVGLAAAAGVVAVEMFKGAQGLDEFNKSLVLSGGFSGQTRDSLEATANVIGSNLTGGVLKAREVLAGLAATGKFTGSEMESVGRAVLDFQHLTGASADVAIKKFEGMTEATVDWARKTNEQYHFLSVTQLEHIKALVEQGNKEQAIIDISVAWHTSMDTSAQKVGMLKMAVGGLALGLDYVLGKLQHLAIGNSNVENVSESIARENELRQRLAAQKALPFSAPGVTESLESDLKAQHAKSIAFIAKANKDEMDAYAKGEFAKTQQAGSAAEAQIANLEKTLRSKEQINADEAKSIKAWADAINAAKIAEGKKAVYTDDQIFELQEKARLKREGDAKTSKGRAPPKDPNDSIRARLQLEADAADAGLSPETYKKINAVLADGNMSLAERNRLIDVALAGDRVLADEQRKLAAAEKEVAQATALINDYRANNRSTLERIARSAELAQMGERERIVAEALYQADDQAAKMNERILRDIKDEAAATKALADVQSELVAQKELVAAATRDQYDASRTFEAGWTKAFNRYQDDAGNAAANAETLFTKSTNAMADALTELTLTGKLTFKSLADSIIGDIVRMSSKMMVSDLLNAGRSSATGGGWVGQLLGAVGLGGTAVQAGIANTLPGDPLDNLLSLTNNFNAKGGVYASPSLSAFSGGVYSTPQHFAFAKGAGVFGEAGPEAIMPLSRDSSGRLGVRSAGSGGGSTVINIHMPPGSPTESRRAAGQGAREAMAALSGARRYS